MTLQVIVRTVGERTLPLCLFALAANGIRNSDICILDNTGYGFHAVLAKSFEVAARLNTTHVLILDADVVLIRDALEQIYEAIARNTEYYRIEFKRLCKFTTKQHGIHLYNISRLRLEGIKYLHECENDLKPESFIVKRMYDNGHELVQLSGATVGYHDFEQYYAHIYAKMINRAMRDPDMLAHIRALALKNPLDFDFAVALDGFELGLRNERKKLAWQDHFGRYLEKPPISDCEAAYGYYEHLPPAS